MYDTVFSKDRSDAKPTSIKLSLFRRSSHALRHAKRPIIFYSLLLLVTTATMIILATRSQQPNKAVLDAIWENLSDEDSGFLEAWADNYPDQDKIDKFRKEIKKNQKKLKKAESDRDKLVEALLSGVLTEEAIKKKNEILSNEIIRLKGKLVKEEQRLSRMPSLEEIKKREEQVKLSFQDYYYSRERFDSMSFGELRGLLFAIFDGKDDEGNPLGVYVKRISPIGKLPVRYEYYINARFFAGHIESDPDDGKGDSGADGNGGRKKSPANSKTNLEDKVGKPQPMTYPRVEDVKCGFFDSLSIPSPIPKDKSFKTCTRSLVIRNRMYWYKSAIKFTTGRRLSIAYSSVCFFG